MSAPALSDALPGSLHAAALTEAEPGSLSDTVPPGAAPGSLATPVLTDAEAASAPARGAPGRRHPPSAEALQARRERAAERAALRSRWLRASQHRVDPGLPFEVDAAPQAITCQACGRGLAVGARVVRLADSAGSVTQLCRTCGRQAILTWSDQRRAEAAAARQLAQDLGDRALPVAVA